MKNIFIVLALLLIGVPGANAAWTSRQAISASPPSGTPTTPIVQSASCTISAPATNGSNVVQTIGAGNCTFSATCDGGPGSCTGANAITGWAITSQTTTNAYSITSNGILQGGSGASGIGTQTDTVTVTATNSSGTSNGQVQTVNAYADGFVNAPSGTLQHAGLLNLGTMVRAGLAGAGSGYSNGGPYTWTGSGCSSNPTGTVTVSGGTLAVVAITSNGSGCPGGEMNITTPAGAGAGTGGQIQGFVPIVRPPWNVAGVDYYVGPQTTPTTDPKTLSVSGVSVDSTGICEVSITGNNVTLNGVKFDTPSCTRNGGAFPYFVAISGNNVTLTNFSTTQIPASSGIGPSAIEITGTGTLLKNCIMNGAPATQTDATSSNALIQITSASGPATTIQYCYMNNSWGSMIAPGHTAQLNLSFNLFENQKVGSPTAHGEVVDTGVGALNQVYLFNATIQDYANAAGYPGFLSSVWETGPNASAPGNVTGAQQSNNTSFLFGTNGHTSNGSLFSAATSVWVDPHNTSGTGSGGILNVSPQFENNYVMKSGWLSAMMTCDGSVITPTVSGNIAMEDNTKANIGSASPCN